MLMKKRITTTSAPVSELVATVRTPVFRWLLHLSALLLGAVLLCLSSLPQAHALGLADTGQTDFYHEDGTKFTPGVNHALYEQDARFVGSQPHFHDNGDGTVTDLNTDLVWQKEDDNTPRTWSEAGQYCENLELAGHDDWKLPQVRALELTARMGHLVSPVCFSEFSCKASSYWAFEERWVASGSSAQAWKVDFKTGLTHYDTKTEEHYVRCVRGTLDEVGTRVGNLHSMGITIIADNGLEWVGFTSFYQGAYMMPYYYAFGDCASLSAGGFEDWRLPDRNELRSMACYGRKDPFYSISIDETGRHDFYLSSTHYYKGTGGTMTRLSVNTAAGAGYDLESPLYEGIAHCVRGGLSQTPDPSASLSGAPSGTVSETSASITVGGDHVAKYRYLLDSGPYSSETDAGTVITLSDLSPGAHTLYVLGVNQEGKLQAPGTEVTATWVVSPPGSLTVASVPENAAKDVARDTAWVFTFSKEMDTSTVNLTISPLQETDYTLSWSADNKVLTVTFKEQLAASTKYSVEIPSTAKAADLTVLNPEFKASFTTLALPPAGEESGTGSGSGSGSGTGTESGGTVPTRSEIQAMLNRGGVSTDAVNSIAAEDVLLVPDTVIRTGAQVGATGSEADKPKACADARAFCAIVAEANMAPGFDPANTVASVKGLQAEAADSTSSEPKIMTLYVSGYLPAGAEFFPRCFKANEAAVATYEFSYVEELTAEAIKQAADSDTKAGFALMDPATGRVVPPAQSLSPLPGGYTLMFFIRDNSRFDSNPKAGVVEDPSYLTSGAGSGSSTGCMLNPSAGFGLEWLMVALCPLLAAMRSYCRK